jgi:cytochrome c553
VHHVQQALVVYQVGQSTQDEAITRKAIRAELPAIVDAVRQQLNVPAQQSTATNKTFAAKCAKCHSGDTALVNPDGTLSLSTLRSFGRMAGLGVDIPQPMKAVIAGLSPQEKGELHEYFLSLPPADVLPAKPESQALPPEPEPGVLR